MAAPSSRWGSDPLPRGASPVAPAGAKSPRIRISEFLEDEGRVTFERLGVQFPDLDRKEIESVLTKLTQSRAIRLPGFRQYEWTGLVKLATRMPPADEEPGDADGEAEDLEAGVEEEPGADIEDDEEEDAEDPEPDDALEPHSPAPAPAPPPAPAPILKPTGWKSQPERIVDAIAPGVTLTIEELEAALPDIKRTSMYAALSKLVNYDKRLVRDAAGWRRATVDGTAPKSAADLVVAPNQRELVLEALADYVGGADVSTICEDTGLSRVAVGAVLSKLKRDGQVREIAVGVWQVRATPLPARPQPAAAPAAPPLPPLPPAPSVAPEPFSIHVESDMGMVDGFPLAKGDTVVIPADPEQPMRVVSAPAPEPPADRPAPDAAPSEPAPRLTKRERIIRALRKHPEGVFASILALDLPDIKRSTLGPELTHLRQEGIVDAVETGYRLREFRDESAERPAVDTRSTHERVVDAMRKFPDGADLPLLANETGIGTRTLRNVVTELRQDGVIEDIGGWTFRLVESSPEAGEASAPVPSPVPSPVVEPPDPLPADESRPARVLRPSSAIEDLLRRMHVEVDVLTLEIECRERMRAKILDSIAALTS